MRHLFLCREFPPSPYPAGGIGTYVLNITRLLAERGETVHLIGQRWEGASQQVERQCDGRLIIHRIAAEDRDLYPSLMPPDVAAREVRAMQASSFPLQWFSWVAAGLAERLVESEGIDLIEGQEWEAPLYYFLLRRSLGLGPMRNPPVVIHLHSPTEYIFRSNDWSPQRRDYLLMKRFEDHVILAADDLLCPSRFLAAQCRGKYGLGDKAVTAIPLPLGDTEPLKRSARVWQNGSVCYFGRLEPRKGVIEFVDAAIEVAYEYPEAIFEFIGADTPFIEGTSVLQYVERRIPEEMRERFIFHGPRPRIELLKMLGGARIAAVPSRWENFPNTALEALSSGIPVLTTRNGGMGEMLADNYSGWLAADDARPLATRLAEALRRALNTPPEQLCEMGDRASRSIRQFCDNESIVARHLAFRRQCAQGGSTRSVSPPQNLPWSERASRSVASPCPAAASGGVAVVVVALAGEDPSATFASLQTQSLPHSALLVSSRPVADPEVGFVAHHGFSTAVARKLALESNKLDGFRAVMFVRAGIHLHPSALAAMTSALDHRAEVGIIVPWTDASTRDFGEIPAFPYQWMADSTGWTALYRAAALRDALVLDPEASDPWELGTAIMAAGWSALRLPALLAVNDIQTSDVRDIAWRRRAIAERYPHLIAQDVATLISLMPTPVLPAKMSELPREQVDTIEAVMRISFRGKLSLVLAASRQPSRSIQWLLWRLRAGLASRGSGRRL